MKYYSRTPALERFAFTTGQAIILIISVFVVFAFSATPAKAATGYLKIITNTKGGDGTFNYSIFPTPSIQVITTVNGTGSSGLIEVDSVEKYIIVRTIQDGWTLNSVNCDDGSSTSQNVTNGVIDVTVSPGQTTTCVFRNTKNTKQGYLKIVTNATIGDGIFDYTVFPTPSIITITTVNGIGSSKLINLDSGTYDILETVPDGWTFNSASCDQSYTSSDSTNSVTSVTVLYGRTTTCTFSNTKNTVPGYLKIINDTRGGDGTFNYIITTYTGSMPMTTSITTVNGTGSSGLIALDSGTTYRITQTLPTGWKFNFLTYPYYNSGCSNGMGNLDITILAGKTTVCNFYNTKKSGLKIVTNTTGGDGTFDYTVSGLKPSGLSITTVNGTGSSGLIEVDPDRAYNITETIPINWKFNSASCDQSHKSSTNNVTNVTVSPGQTTTCVFSNTKNGTSSQTGLKIIKSTTGGNGIFTYNIAGTTSFSSNITTSGGIGSSGLITINPGTYDISEIIPDGWKFNSAFCDHAYTHRENGVTNVNILDGQTTTCTFSNKNILLEPIQPPKKGSLLIVKQISNLYNDFTINDSYWYQDSRIFGIFNYIVDGPTPFNANITLNNGYVNKGVASSSDNFSVNPGTYNIQETSQNGWTFNYAYCNKPYTSEINGVINVTVLPEQQTICTFHGTNYNKPLRPTLWNNQGFLKIITNTAGGDETFNYTVSKYSLKDVTTNITTVNGTGSSGIIGDLQVGTSIGSVNYSYTAYVVKQTVLSETDQNDWTLSSAFCGQDIHGILGQTVVNPINGITAYVHPGITTTCVFNNIKNPVPSPGYIKIITTTSGADGIFDYSINGSQYSNMYARGINITTSNHTGSSEPVELSPTSISPNLSEPVELRTDEIPGMTYSITATAPDGWTFNSAICDDQTSYINFPNTTLVVKNVTVSPGQTTICTFSITKNNIPLGILKIIKKTKGGDGIFNFTVFPTPSITTIATVNGTGSSEIMLDPNTTYAIIEINSDGWTSNSVLCGRLYNNQLLYTTTSGPGQVIRNSVTNISVSPGQTAICTFNNTKDIRPTPTVKVEKPVQEPEPEREPPRKTMQPPY